jgi:hypothetical protein
MAYDSQLDWINRINRARMSTLTLTFQGNQQVLISTKDDLLADLASCH